jgi:hypothetical protein
MDIYQVTQNPQRVSKLFCDLHWGQCFQKTPVASGVLMKQNHERAIDLESATLFLYPPGEYVYPVEAVCHFTPIYKE